ncbi:sterol desaturase family protein [Coraliomargarita algicola]|uniref:Sterol desaturase family protein n=1 Tax=Coraliomargarita algicola TaxID=3092156 RepID=A0ABZ0RNG4_9BACT|nr:sterol desaturase family protein [Coraliomargarita sp. J2-16]WPJ96638.1 sterol desaturase family protein [Coraliomargarita sp. J2-16]
MWDVIWNTRSYFFWLMVVSLFCALAERMRPWRQGQRFLRAEFFQDLFWLFFNGHYFSILFAYVSVWLTRWWLPAMESAQAWNLLAAWPLWAQGLFYFVLKDWLDWCVHNLLHRVPALWEFHKIHHSITEMDWIGNFRFHWMEIVVYQSITYFPLVVLGVDPTVLLIIAVLNTLIGHLNHSNLDLSWGPLRYLLNSSRMHIWHHMHDLPEARRQGVNFGISLSVWDWLFRTAYWPSLEERPTQQPDTLGFPGMERVPVSLHGRLWSPFKRMGHRVRNSVLRLHR